jgi:chemotaxis methyl-accepting protein methylase
MTMSGCYSSQQVEKVGQNSLTECFETRKSYFSQDKIREALPFEEMILFKKIMSSRPLRVIFHVL